MKPFAFKNDILKKTVPVIILFGILFTADYFVIGPFIPEVAADYERGISAAYFIASLTYGGVVEEILMRWFLMSLLAWILVLIFARKTEKTELPDWIFIRCEYHRGAPVCGRTPSCDYGIFRAHQPADFGGDASC